jgi:hypothetical protein
MESYEVLRRAVEQVGAKKVAGQMKVSPSLVYKWCQQVSESEPDESSGARNPLDRVCALLGTTGDSRLVAWLCQQAGGFFVQNPNVPENRIDAEYIAHTQRIIEEFSDLLRVVSDAIADDGQVDQKEAERIRAAWEELKQYGEAFVCACEQGQFEKKR